MVLRPSPDGPLGGIVRSVDWYTVEKGSTEANKIPAILRSQKQWIWLEERKRSAAGHKKPPYLCRGVEPCDALTPKNWVGFVPSTDLAGVAFVLNDHPLLGGLRPVAIEITPQSGLNWSEVNDLWLALGRPYLEFSGEAAGWTIVGLVSRPLPTYEGGGVKIFTGSEYVELCGLGAMGELKDITGEVMGLNAYRAPPPKPGLTAKGCPDTPRRRAELEAALRFISADCGYDVYRSIVWAVLGTGWAGADDIARRWCMTAPHRFDEKSFRLVVNSFNPALEKRPTVGTIFYLARKGGWCG